MRRQGDRFALPTARGDSLELKPRLPRLGRDVEQDRLWLERVKRPWAVDLFCGAGGLSLGLEDAGFRVIAAADSDQHAVETHAANLRGMAWRLDLSTPEPFIDRLRRRGVERVDLVAGGPPCQPFSRAGSAKIRSLVAEGTRPAIDARVALWNTFLGVVDALDPRAVVLENVPDMARWEEGDIVVTLMDALRERGFDPEARVLNAWEYGVPQHRARLFLVATRNVGFVWPRRRPVVTVRDAIGDLPPIPPAQRDHVLPYTATPTTRFQRRARRHLRGIDAHVVKDHCSRDVRADDAEAFALLPEGGTYADLPARLQRYRSDIFDDKYKRLAWDEVSRTITAHIAKDGYWYIHPAQHRTLSIREAARIQTFPDQFRFAGHPTIQYRQIGNAVPPALASAVGRRVAVALLNRAAPAAAAARTQLDDWAPRGDEVAPWLRTADPWHVLAGEVTLRRCSPKVARCAWQVVAEHARSPADAAAAREVLERMLRATGVPATRSQALIAVAEALIADHAGEVPSDEVTLLQLPHVGPHVATAVRCFGQGKRAVFLDAATKRLAQRLSGRKCSSAWTIRLELYRLCSSSGPDRRFNLALNALTGAYCTPAAPRCDECPVALRCKSALRTV
jgi:DNA (cytosine-5)-methyltransferase 1